MDIIIYSMDLVSCYLSSGMLSLVEHMLYGDYLCFSRFLAILGGCTC